MNGPTIGRSVGAIPVMASTLTPAAAPNRGCSGGASDGATGAGCEYGGAGANGNGAGGAVTVDGNVVIASGSYASARTSDSARTTSWHVAASTRRVNGCPSSGGSSSVPTLDDGVRVMSM